MNGPKEEKCLSAFENGSNHVHLDGQKHADHHSQNHSFFDECRSPVKSECSMNGDTEEQSHSTEKIVWICCDVYDTGIGIPGIYLFLI